MPRPVKAKLNQVRIIGGCWRGRKLHFPALTELRPTPDRVRETVFNWLAPHIQNSHCLDLFAGSGALGIEALSRGATHTTFVDHATPVIQTLKTNLKQLDAKDQATLIKASFPRIPLETTTPFDIVFLDPPFAKQLLPDICHWLEEHQLLAPNALIYIEMERDCTALPPEHWKVVKRKAAGNVIYSLWQLDIPP